MAAGMTRVFLPVMIFALSGLPTAELIRTFYMKDYCGRTIYMGTSGKYSVKIKTSLFAYSSNMDCKVHLSAPSSDKLSFNFESVDIHDCPSDYLQITDGSIYLPLSTTISGKICGYIPSGQMVSTTDDAVMRFVSDSSVSGAGFTVIVTAFEDGPCYSWDFECTNGRCIDKDLCNDGYDNCGDNSDASSCSGYYRGDNLWWVWMLIGIGAFIFLVSVITCIACSCCKQGRQGRVVQTGAAVTTTTYNSGTHAVTVAQSNPWYNNPAQQPPVAYGNPALQPPGTYQPPSYTSVSGSTAYPPPPTVNPVAPPPYSGVQAGFPPASTTHSSAPVQT